MKKILFCIISVIIVCSLSANALAAIPFYGDADKDGSITVADALAVLRISAGLTGCSEDDLVALDINKDGSVSVDDALIVLRAATGLESINQPLIPANVDVGDTVTIGKYEQDNNNENGKEDIEWTVISKSSGKVLLISRYALDAVSFNSKLEETTWKKSTMRSWLNEGFIKEAFSNDELTYILDTKTKSDYNPKYNSNVITTTTDKVFLLTYTEAGKYFGTDESRKCIPTKYAISGGVTVNGDSNCIWWLRTLGYDTTYATVVNVYGELASFGYNVEEEYIALRPAMWISIEG